MLLLFSPRPVTNIHVQEIKAESCQVAIKEKSNHIKLPKEENHKSRRNECQYQVRRKEKELVSAKKLLLARQFQPIGHYKFEHRL